MYLNRLGMGGMAGTLIAAAVLSGCGGAGSKNAPKKLDGENGFRNTTVSASPMAAATPEALETETLPAGFVAKITEAQAKATASAARPGTVTKSVLEDENGTVVYGVEITGTDGLKYDVKIDAATGTVVSNQSEASEGVEGTETEGKEGTGVDADGANGPNDQSGEQVGK